MSSFLTLTIMTRQYWVMHVVTYSVDRQCSILWYTIPQLSVHLMELCYPNTPYIHPSHILYCSFGLFVFSCKHTTSRSLFGHWSMLLVSLSLVGGRYISLAFFFDCFVLLVKIIRLINQLKQTNYVIHETIYDPNITRFYCNEIYLYKIIRQTKKYKNNH